MTERIDQLEIKLAYTEDLVTQLNEVVIEQQKVIDALEQSIKKLNKKMEDMVSQGELKGAERPPHY